MPANPEPPSEQEIQEALTRFEWLISAYARGVPIEDVDQEAMDTVRCALRAEREKAKLLLDTLQEVSRCQEGFGEHEKCEESLCGPTHDAVNKALYVAQKAKALRSDAGGKEG